MLSNRGCVSDGREDTCGRCWRGLASLTFRRARRYAVPTFREMPTLSIQLRSALSALVCGITGTWQVVIGLAPAAPTLVAVRFAITPALR